MHLTSQIDHDPLWKSLGFLHLCTSLDQKNFGNYISFKGFMHKVRNIRQPTHNGEVVTFRSLLEITRLMSCNLISEVYIKD
jgi:hypothetical protein